MVLSLLPFLNSTNPSVNAKSVKSFPVIVELTDKDGKILATEYSENNPTIEFLLIEPQKYSLRVIYDENKCFLS